MPTRAVRYYLTLSALILLFFISLGSSFIMFQSFLKTELQLDAAQISIIYTAIAFIALFCAPVFGVWQGMLGTSRKLLAIIGIGLALTTPILGVLFVVAAKFSFVLAVAIAGLYFGTIIQSGVSSVESYCEQATRRLGYFEYGQVRLWAPLGASAATVMSGFWLTFNPYICFWVSSISGILFLIALMTLDTTPLERVEEASAASSKKKSPMEDIRALMSNSKFWRLVSYLFIVSGGFMLFDQQYPIFFSELFEIPEVGQQIAGSIMAVQMLIEAACTIFLPFIITKTGARNGLLIAGAIMGIRILTISLTAYIPASYQIYWAGGLKLLQAIEIPLLILSTFKYIAQHFEERFTATVFLIGFQCSQQVSTIFLSSLIGLSYKTSLGYTGTYTLMALVILALTFLAIFTLPRRTSSSQDSGEAVTAS